LVGIAAALLSLAAWGAGPANGDPAFGETPLDYSTADFGFQKSAIAAGDLSGDGVPDLTMAGSGIAALRLSGGTSTAAQNMPIGSDEFTDIFFDPEIEYRDVGIAQLSGDSRPDIIGVGDGGARRSVQNGSGGFEPDGDRLSQVDLRALAIGPVDGDALSDVVVVGPTGAWVMLRQAGGGLAAPQSVATSLTLTDVALGDFNGDGRTDIAVAGTTGARVLLQSAGSFSFAAGPGSPIVTGSLESIVAGRFDSDRTLDIAASRPGDDRVVIRLGNASAPGAFIAAPDVGLSDNPGALAAADLDLNGTTDLAVARRLASDAATEVRDRVTILSGAGNGTFSPGATINVYEAGQADQEGNEVRSIAVADVDGDGRPDLLFADFALSAAIMARNTSIVVLPPGGGGGGGGAGSGGGGGRAGPGLAVSAARSQKLSLTRGIAISASCATDCTLTARGKISLRPRARKKITLGAVTRKLRAGEPTRITLRIPRRRWPAITRALSRGLRVQARIVITATDGRGDDATQVVVFRLLPRRPGRG
jgi:hypothetical protein